MYGVCPKCGKEVVGRERRPNGNDVCAGGHTYPSCETLPQHTYDRVSELTTTLTELSQSASELLAQMPLIAPKGAETLREGVEKAKAVLAQVKTVDNASEWISVKDRLPELPENLNASNHSVSVLVAIQGTDDVLEAEWVVPIYNKNKSPRWERCGRLLHWEPTHWQPLPQPPKQESDDE